MPLQKSERPPADAPVGGLESVDFGKPDTHNNRPDDDAGQGDGAPALPAGPPAGKVFQLRLSAWSALPAQDTASFTSWKLDLLNAILIDPRVNHSSFRVAFALVQFMNAKTGLMCPAQETLAERACMSVRNVQDCLNELRETRWLNWTRGNRQQSNSYEFNSTNVSYMLDRRTSLDDGRRERRKARVDAKALSRQKLLTRSVVHVAMRSPVPVPRRSGLPANTSMQHPEGTPEVEWAWEEEDDF
jgi:hypothetical protein